MIGRRVSAKRSELAEQAVRRHPSRNQPGRHGVKRGDGLVRLLQLIELLKHRRWTLLELAHELEISKRTVIRDLHILRRAGISVQATGYQLGDRSPRQFSIGGEQ